MVIPLHGMKDGVHSKSPESETTTVPVFLSCSRDVDMVVEERVTFALRSLSHIYYSSIDFGDRTWVISYHVQYHVIKKTLHFEASPDALIKSDGDHHHRTSSRMLKCSSRRTLNAQHETPRQYRPGPGPKVTHVENNLLYSGILSLG